MNNAELGGQRIPPETTQDQTGGDPPETVAPGASEATLARMRKRLRGVLGLRTTASVRQSIEGMLKGADALVEFSPSERFMLLNILRFSELRVDDAMVPRVDIVAVEMSAPLSELVRAFQSAGHSRLPVYRETLDDPVGFVHIKDLLARIVSTEPEPEDSSDDGSGESMSEATSPPVDLSSPIGAAGLIRDLLFVPESMRSIDLLIRMQSSRVHMAIVIDEYGGTDGLVTIEDLIEEIVGDIEDEHDQHEGPLIRRSGDAFIADARAPIDDVEALLDVKLTSADRDEDVDTLGGLVFSLVGRIPVRGEILRHPAGVEFEVLDSDLRRIKQLRVRLHSESGSDDARD